jgi:branched-chain amino acid transport system substrate-binding protein
MQRLDQAWRRGVIAWTFLAAVVALPSYGRPGAIPHPPAGRAEMTVGALLSISGEWSSLGIASRSALEIAARDINATMARRGAKTRVRVVVRDTKLEPGTALRELASLAGRGVKVVIGPQSSAEVRALKPYADRHGIVLISQGSTASSLAVAGDNVFRFVPDDTHEATAIAALMREDGTRTVVPFWRDDAGNQGLRDSLKRAVEAGGGTMTGGVRYPAATEDFSAQLKSIRSQVGQEVARSGAASVAVFLAAFDEAALIFRRAQTDPVLSSVRWYGADGVALSQALVVNPAARFAVASRYPCPTFGLGEASSRKWKPVADRVRARTGIAPDALALSAYDALWVAVLAAERAGGAGSTPAFKKALVETAASYAGITGSVALNEAGDRRSGSYDFWAVRAVGKPSRRPSRRAPVGAFHWTRVAVYRSSPVAAISRLGGR